MKLLILFLFFSATITTSPLFSMIDEKTNTKASIDIKTFVQDLQENGFCWFDIDSDTYQVERDHDILLLLIRYTKPADENDQNLVDCLHTIFNYVRSMNGLEKLITPRLAADIIKYLNISIKDVSKEGLSLLHDAAFFGDSAVVETLCLAGARVDAIDPKYKWTSLHMAADKGHGDVCLVLLEHKAPINAQTSTDDTPLHFAAENGHTLVCRILKTAGADTYKKNSLKKTPGRLGRKHPTIAEVFGDLALS